MTQPSFVHLLVDGYGRIGLLTNNVCTELLIKPQISQGLEISMNWLLLAPVDILHDTNVRRRASLEAFELELTLLSFFFPPPPPG